MFNILVIIMQLINDICVKLLYHILQYEFLGDTPNILFLAFELFPLQRRTYERIKKTCVYQP